MREERHWGRRVPSSVVLVQGSSSPSYHPWGFAVTRFFDLRYLFGSVMARQPPSRPASKSYLEQAWKVLAFTGCVLKSCCLSLGHCIFNKISCLTEKVPWRAGLVGGQAGSWAVKVSACPGWVDTGWGPGQQVEGQ